MQIGGEGGRGSMGREATDLYTPPTILVTDLERETRYIRKPIIAYTSHTNVYNHEPLSTFGRLPPPGSGSRIPKRYSMLIRMRGKRAEELGPPNWPRGIYEALYAIPEPSGRGRGGHLSEIGCSNRMGKTAQALIEIGRTADLQLIHRNPTSGIGGQRSPRDLVYSQNRLASL